MRASLARLPGLVLITLAALMESRPALGKAESLLLKVQPVADGSSDHLVLRIENTSDRDLGYVSLSLTVKKADGVSMEDRIKIKKLPANSKTDTVVWVPVSSDSARITKIAVDPATLRTTDGKRANASIKVQYVGAPTSELSQLEE